MPDEILLYQTDDGATKLQVRFGEETVWLSQAQMADLFQRDQSVIARHIQNVHEEQELDPESTMLKMHSASSVEPLDSFQTQSHHESPLSPNRKENVTWH